MARFSKVHLYLLLSKCFFYRACDSCACFDTSGIVRQDDCSVTVTFANNSKCPNPCTSLYLKVLKNAAPSSNSLICTVQYTGGLCNTTLGCTCALKRGGITVQNTYFGDQSQAWEMIGGRTDKTVFQKKLHLDLLCDHDLYTGIFSVSSPLFGFVVLGPVGGVLLIIIFVVALCKCKRKGKLCRGPNPDCDTQNTQDVDAEVCPDTPAQEENDAVVALAESDYLKNQENPLYLNLAAL